MNPITPLATSVVQSTQVQRQQASDKDRQTRRVVEVRDQLANREDQFEHQVESSEELTAIHDEDETKQDAKKREKRKGHEAPETSDEEPRLDITA